MICVIVWPSCSYSINSLAPGSRWQHPCRLQEHFIEWDHLHFERCSILWAFLIDDNSLLLKLLDDGLALNTSRWQLSHYLNEFILNYQQSSLSMMVYNKNPCAWLLWHWSSQGQLALCKFNWPSEDQCQRSHSKWVFVFIPHLKCKYSQLIISKLPRKAAICPRPSPWWLIVLVHSLRSTRLDTAWLVKSVTYFNLIG